VNNRLRELRAARQWSQADLADQLAVSRQTVNSIENGRYDPSLPLAFRIAAVFARPIEEIFFPSTEPEPSAGLPNDPHHAAPGATHHRDERRPRHAG
jgi:putative transcriptional regulator